MIPIFEREISIYRNLYDNEGCTTKVGTFLFSTRHANEVLAIRAQPDENIQKMMKKQLPAAAISGRFSVRNSKNVVEHSGLMCIDIDGKDNPHLCGHWEEVKKELSVIPEIAYIGLSVRGNGLFTIIPIRYPEWHLLHYLQLEDDFKRMGIIIDKNCKEVNRLRIISYDPAPYVNAEATTYERYKVVEKPIRKQYNYTASEDETIDKVSRLCQVIDHNGIDLTTAYNDWFKIGCSLADLGEAGRAFYHICSRQNSGYKETECDKKFSNLLATTSKYTIATFFDFCKQWNIKY